MAKVWQSLDQEFELALLDGLRSFLATRGIAADFRAIYQISTPCMIAKVELDDPSNAWWRRSGARPFLRVSGLYATVGCVEDGEFVIELEDRMFVYGHDFAACHIPMADPNCFEIIIDHLSNLSSIVFGRPLQKSSPTTNSK